MNKKGFTLVELLAVIVVLLIIALVAFPSLISSIKKNEEDGYNAAVENITLAAQVLNFNYSGSIKQVPVSTLIDMGYLSGKQTNPKDNTEMNGCIVISDNNYYYKEENCEFIYDSGATLYTKYKEKILNGAEPVLSEGMIPVVISNNGTVKKADLNEKKNPWYIYEEKKWANAVLVTESSRDKYINASANATITQSDILAYFVWIPRYKYQLFNATGDAGTAPQEIQIVFENKDTVKSSGTTNGEWLTHPAFTFGDEELNGIWVGKFETTGSATTPTILPGISSLRNQNVSQEFKTSQLFNNTTKYGINNDAHMAKNSEWGAVAYLTQSKYGLNGEVSINNSKSYITGSSAGRPADSTTSSSTVYAYNTNEGTLASTTGNITGIYDMSGGAFEYVMGDLVDADGNKHSGYSSLYNSGYNGMFNGGSLTTGIDFPDEKYYQVYTENQNVLGDAMLETAGWYADENSYASLPNAPWFSRGGSYSWRIFAAGIWCYNCAEGCASSGGTFRTIIIN